MDRKEKIHKTPSQTKPEEKTSRVHGPQRPGKFCLLPPSMARLCVQGQRKGLGVPGCGKTLRAKKRGDSLAIPCLSRSDGKLELPGAQALEDLSTAAARASRPRAASVGVSGCPRPLLQWVLAFPPLPGEPSEFRAAEGRRASPRKGFLSRAQRRRRRQSPGVSQTSRPGRPSVPSAPQTAGYLGVGLGAWKHVPRLALTAAGRDLRLGVIN